MNVVNIRGGTPHKAVADDSVETLRYLLDRALRGDLWGVAVCAKDRTGHEEIAFTGIYNDDPACAVNAANRMSWRMTQLQDERDAQAF